MEVMAVGAQDGQNYVRRKEWRAVSDSPVKDRRLEVNTQERVNHMERQQKSLGSGTPCRSRGNGRLVDSGEFENGTDCSYQHPVNSTIHCHSSLPPTPKETTSEDHFEHVILTPSIAPPEHPDCSLEQRLIDIVKQREQLQQAEVELKARFLAQAEIMRLQSGFDEQAKQQSDIVANLQGLLKEKDQQINVLEQRLEERERQLHNNQMEANEALNQAWAKDGLLREQSTELTALRRERENLVADQKAASSQWDVEQMQCLAQVEDLKEQIRGRDMQLQEIGEQHRATQDMLSFKEEQLRDFQAWMAHAQELDAYHISANSSLQLELRERIEQMNQLWLGYQRQLAELEIYHAQSIKRLQQQLTEVKEQNRFLENGRGFDKNIKRPTINGSKAFSQTDVTNDPHSNGTNQVEICGMVGQVKSSIQLNGSADGLVPLFSHDSFGKVEHATGLPVVPTPVVGLTTLHPPGGLGGLHRFNVLHPSMAPLQPSLQGSQQALSQMQPLAAPLSQQQYLSQAQHQQTQSATVQSHALWQQHSLKPVVQQHISYAPITQSQSTLHSKHIDIEENAPHHHEKMPEGRPNRHDFKQVDSILPNCLSQHHSHIQSMHQLPQASREVLYNDQVSPFPVGMDLKSEPSQLQLQGSFSVSSEWQLDKIEQKGSESIEEPPKSVKGDWQSYEKHSRSSFPVDHSCQQVQFSPSSQGSADAVEIQQGNQISSSSQKVLEDTMSCLPVALLKVDSSFNNSEHDPSSRNIVLKRTVVQTSSHQVSDDSSPRPRDSMLLDESSLLACLVRAVPAEPVAKIKISSTLPNRLGKMLAPLHWHDYRTLYGRLDEFLGSHTELFVIEGDFIHLREGAHAAVSTMTAVAKAAAAAAATSMGPSLLPTVAVTPVAKSQIQRLRSSKNSFYSQKETLKDQVVQETSKQSPLSSPELLQPGNMQDQNFMSKSTPMATVHIAIRSHGTTGHSAAHHSGKVDDLDRGLRDGKTTTVTAVGILEKGISGGVLSPRMHDVRENGSLMNKPQSRNQEIHARPQTQESCILGVTGQ